MPGYSLGHLQNHIVLQGFVALLKNDRGTTAQLLAHIGEIDARRIYADEGFTSMFDYCVRVHHFTEDMAGMRIRAARTARRFPVVFDAIAEGRLTVTAVCLVSKHLKRLTREAALELLAASEHKTKDAIRLLLAERFPQPDLQARVTTLPRQNVELRVVAHVPERVEVRDSSSDVSGVEKGASEPAPLIMALPPEPRAVHERDGGQCTFESSSGRRCDGTSDLEYDHIIPKARGGKSTVANLRLRCHAHNQLEAERAFGAGFMEKKRAEARMARASGEAPPPPQ